ncbi:MAG TPA: 4Fe-4S binding protein, partial [Chitinispirillaceae bacterium]|nr:4Fe-4S binding protein [Chitinispirillaceae bacterium]
MTRKIRIISQISFFVIFITLLFIFNNKACAHLLQTELFLQLNPLVCFLTSIASRTVIYAVLPGALIITLLTLLFGRFFCGFICPLGAAIDFSDKFIFEKYRFRKARPGLVLQKLKYVLLFTLFVFSLSGLVIPLFMDPISIATRISASLIDPTLRFLGLTSSNMLTSFSNLFSKEPKAVSLITLAMPGSAAVFILTLAVFAGSFIDRRFWCQYVCPSGAFFALLSRFSFFRRHVECEKCNKCKICSTRTCPTRAIDPENFTMTSNAECILCGACATNQKSCTKVTITVPRKKETSPVNIQRRHVLSGLLLGITTPVVLRGTVVRSASVQPVRPPGSIPESDFLTRCIACGQCIKACPNHALGPSGIFDGLHRISTPRLMAQNGYCETGCTTCTHVCPTLAIRPVTTDDKSFVKTGTAIVNRHHCLAWKGDIRCMICM